MIRNLHGGRELRLAQLKALCEVLEFDFCIGPKRKIGAVDELRLEEALEATVRTLKAHAVRPGARDRARAVAALYELLDRTREPSTAQRVERLIEVLTGKGRASAERQLLRGPIPARRRVRTNPVTEFDPERSMFPDDRTCSEGAVRRGTRHGVTLRRGILSHDSRRRSRRMAGGHRVRKCATCRSPRSKPVCRIGPSRAGLRSHGRHL